MKRWCLYCAVELLSHQWLYCGEVHARRTRLLTEWLNGKSS